MFKLLKEAFTLLSIEQRKSFYLLQVMVVLMAFTEIIGVASIIPFMALVGDVSQLKKNTVLAEMYQITGLNSETLFIFILGAAVLLMLFVSTIISMFTTWRLAMFGHKVGAEIGDRLYTYYLNQCWLFHSTNNSAQLTKKIAIEAQRVTNGILMPLIQLNSRIILAILIIFSIFIYDSKVAIIGIIFFALAYYILFRVVRVRLQQNGFAISEVNERRFRLMNEGFGGIKDVLLLGRSKNLTNEFKQTGVELAYSNGANVALSQVPRYFMEFIAFGSMMALLLYLIVNHNGNLGMILPILSVYAFAGFKLLPAFQQIYASIAGIKGSIAAFESIKKELSETEQGILEPKSQENTHLVFKKQISLEGVSFTYPNKKEKALNEINITIPVNNLVGIVGPSGSGKSTLIDVLLGLIKPQKGHMKIDDKILNQKNCRLWQKRIGFVAQNIFLSEGTIAQNIAFAIPREKINFDKVKKVLKLSNLDDFVTSLDEGMHTKVGERGVQLSGGQQQRIGIARALYNESDVLIFDEATSSLDGITEKVIMEAIHKFGREKTIILIAHRLKTDKNCDLIFFVEKGKIVDCGTYEKLLEKNQKFKKMVKYS